MPLSERVAPCAYCLREAAEEINEQTGEAVGIAAVNVNEVTIGTRTCIKCISHFCPDHASPVDQSDCCFACLPFEAITEMKTPLVTVTDEGNHVLRKGYRLVPTGVGYKTLPQAITDMTDEQLEAFITEKALQIHNVEKQRDFLRVAQSTAKLEKNEREAAAQRALYGYKIPAIIPSKGIKITGKVDKANGTVKGVVGAGGINIADFLKFAASKIAAKQASPKVEGGAASPSKAPAAQSPQAVPAKKEGKEMSPPSPPLKTKEEIAEQAREAEIEKILEGGEPNGDKPENK